VVIELATDVQFARDLAAGGVFVPGCALRLAQECDLLVCGANHQVVLPARVVYVDEHRGAGLELVGFSTEMKAQLAELDPVVRTSVGFADAVDAPVVVETAADDSMNDGVGLGPALLDEEPELFGFNEPVPLVVLEALDDDLPMPILDHDQDDPARDTQAYPQLRGDDEADTGRNAANHTYPFGIEADDDQADPGGDDSRASRARAGHARIADGSVETPAYPRGRRAGDEADEADEAHELELTLGDYDDDGNDDRDPAVMLSGGHEMGDDAEATLGGAEQDGAEAVVGARRRRDSTKPFARNVHERLRGLNLAAQIKLAVSGELHERIVLERLYGKNVWETLLRNPRLTAPEVSRIARYGSLPRVLLEIIVGNNAWLQIPEVRRALLSNPRLATDQVVKVLRLTPKHELKLATVQTAYPVTVRNAAKMLLRDSH